ncbi:hypothetical protein BU25DRAFT_117629 [Macroventuria anomochaeta]|uniref:Uncharacterized protein n=1 Tax=Macroventuria anomochaeta TaxID=301207 RepID=A0ACB6RVV0_9PLEO|nr:uncharacterized protein BU25DRAFT_117629 [Macroventuria anomochaeta]KAF2625259.1 hypothetical protein BU25DRAFT_117629 [Macroventuria anomochaeta]
MNYDDYPHPIRRSPRAAHELQQVFEQLQLENNRCDYDEDEEDDYSDSDQETPPPTPRRHPDSYDEPSATSPREPPPRSPLRVNPLRSHPVAADRTPAETTPAPRPAPRYRFSHPFREQLYAPRQPDPAPRRHPTTLVSYKPANQHLHPRLRKRTSLDTIASVTTTASVLEPDDVETPSPSMFTLESEYPITPDVDLGPPPMSEPPKSASLPESLRTASVSSTHSMHPTTPVSSAETYPPRGILRKLKPGKRKDSVGTDGGAERLVIERTVSVDQTSYHSNSSSASNTISSGAPSRYPPSETGNSRSSSAWTASSHDISGLTPEELKKCKKKGINPALFAEMKAARKGRWTSPIAGNTFLS